MNFNNSESNSLELQKFLDSKKYNEITQILKGKPPNSSNNILKDIIPAEIKEYIERNKYGFGLHEIIIHFDETFNMSTKTKVSSFLEKFKNVEKWSIYSDYAFYNKDKNNDVVSFVLLPYLHSFPALSSALKSLSNKDLKHNKKVRPQFIKFFNHFPMISFNFIFTKKRFSINPFLESKNYFEEMVQHYINYQIFLTIVDFNKYNDFNNKIKKYKKFIDYIKRKGTNRKMIHDLMLIGQLAGYLSSTISRLHGNISLMGWFSDKDSFFNINKSNLKDQYAYIIDFFSETAHQIHHKYNTLENKLVVGTSENTPFLDDILRLPDLLAGTMADWDTTKNILSHDKFIDIINEIFTNNSNHFFINMHFKQNNTFQTSILDIRRKKKRRK